MGDGLPRRSAPRNDKIRGLSVSVIARRGKAPTRQSVSHAKNKSPDGGIDKLPNHVILKLKRGAAGRREPLNVALEK